MTTSVDPERRSPPAGVVLAAALALAGFLLTLSLARPAGADEFHYNDILVGDRAAGMGGAYTAVSDDATGLYHNPAGTTYAEGGSLSGSMNTFHSTRTRYDDVLGGRGWERRSNVLVPNFFGVVQPLGRWTLGFSYAVPDSVEEDQDQTFFDLPGTRVSRYVINLNERDATYNIGPSCAVRLHDKLSLGVTLYGHYRKKETVFNQLLTLDDGTYEWTNSYFETEEYGVLPIVGLLWEVSERLAFGARVSRTFVLSADTSSQVIFKDVGFDGDTVVYDTLDGSDRRKYPLETSVGVALFPTHALLLAADFRYHHAVHDAFGDREATWNAALGLEYYLNPRWALRTGLFTNRANTPELRDGRAGQDPHVDIYGGSLSLSRFTRNSAVTLGASLGRGNGEDQVVAGTTRTQDVRIDTLSVFLSASYRY